MGVIYLVRHGQASFGAADYDQLSPLGEEQTRRLGDWISACGLSISAIATGTQKRHRQSAVACGAACPAPAPERWRADAGFNEFDHVEVLVRHRPEFAAPRALSEFLGRADDPRRAFQQVFSQAVARWVSGEHDAEYAESFAAFRERVMAALRRTVETAVKGEGIWVFTSGGAITAIVQGLLAIPDARIFDLNWTLVNTGVTKLLHGRGRVSLSYVNGHAHLERLQRPELITYR
ncbi:MAG TPA: histidine phosphatase family protein [Geobacteraceae bacterium]